jgi:spore germination cell wall hydrolase CwlJ-like protein
MTLNQKYIAFGIAVFLAHSIYSENVSNKRIDVVEHAVIAIAETNSERMGNIENAVIAMAEDVQEIKEKVLGHQPITIKYNKKDVECLARNIFWEAGIEDMTGKIAVGNVTINRVKTNYWGKDICSVVYAPAQFSWTKKRDRAWVELNGSNWEDSKAAAHAVLDGIIVKKLDKALFYHADYVDPYWKDKSKRVLKVGQHIFYTQAKGGTLKL